MFGLAQTLNPQSVTILITGTICPEWWPLSWEFKIGSLHLIHAFMYLYILYISVYCYPPPPPPPPHTNWGPPWWMSVMSSSCHPLQLLYEGLWYLRVLAGYGEIYRGNWGVPLECFCAPTSFPGSFIHRPRDKRAWEPSPFQCHVGIGRCVVFSNSAHWPNMYSTDYSTSIWHSWAVLLLVIVNKLIWFTDHIPTTRLPLPTTYRPRTDHVPSTRMTQAQA